MKIKFSDIEILEKICQTKYNKLQKLGASLGYEIPKERNVDIIKPVVLIDKTQPLIIAEIKRASPTKGNIGQILNPIELANTYLTQGANTISVLCEEDYFNGSIKDLQNIKNAFPSACILRKDFILHKDEIRISYFCGADMVLLIVSVFVNNMESFIEIYNEILSYNLTPLIEIHNLYEYSLISNLDLTNAIVGINSRNLKTFKINKMDAIKLRTNISTNIPVIFESGIQSDYDAFIAGSSGFNGILCGSFLVEKLDCNNSNNALNNLKKAFLQGNKQTTFFTIMKRFYDKNHAVNNTINSFKPLVKVCGINNKDFLIQCLKYADLIGFILADKSPRFVDIDFMKQADEVYNQYFTTNINYKPIRIGVVTKTCISRGIECIKKGYVDCLQLHDMPIDFFTSLGEYKKNANIFYGDISIWNLNNEIKNYDILPFYPTLSYDLSNLSQNNNDFNTNFVLFDNSAGSANKLDIQKIKNFISQQEIFINNLWLAGGICKDNIIDVLKLNPILIDICSGFESYKGKKDIQLMLDFFSYFDSYFLQ